MKRVDVPVLVAGAGPVGLLAGILLSQQGVASRVVEQRAAPQRSPAAHVVSARTFEICRAAGVPAAAIDAACVDPADAGHVRFLTTLAGEELGSLPFERQGREALDQTPTPLRNLAQSRFEPILLDALRKAPGADVAYGHRWEGAEQDAEGVTSQVRDLASGEVYAVRSRYLLGADGAGSRVRKGLGIAMEGPAKIETFLMVHFAADLRALVRTRPGILHWILDPAAGGTLVAHDIDREWVYMRPMAEGETADDYPPERCDALIRRALGPADVTFGVSHVGSWTMTAQVAERYRDGRIFLVGDAAHRFPPTGGLGLNTGAQDVHGLAWRLAAVLQGWAPEALLTSYERERKPVAEHNASQSLRNALKLLEVPRALGTLETPTTAQMESVLARPETRARVEAAIADQAEHFDMPGLQLGYVYAEGALAPEPEGAGAPDPVAENPTRQFVPTGRPGARMPHAWVERGDATVSTLDLLWPQGFTLVTVGGHEAWADAVARLPGAPLRHVALGREAPGAPGGRDARDPSGTFASVSGLGADGALLVRPDQHVAWRARTRPGDPAAALRDALATIGMRAG